MTFLIVAVAGLAFSLNARRALRGALVVVPAFFASWLVIELAPHLLALHVAGTALFVGFGGLDEWWGFVALALSIPTGVLLWQMTREAASAHDVFDAALTDAIGPAAAHRPVLWREFVLPFKLWSRRIRRVRNVPYREPGTRRHRLDVWHPKDEGRERPCLLYVPGGAWTVGISNKNHQGKPLLIEMAAQGWVCFAMNYPVSPRATFPAHIIAVKAAIAWIRAHAHEYGGDPRFLMVSGNSAGGHLSSLAALTPNEAEYQPGFEDADTSVQAAAVLYGVYDISGATLELLTKAQQRHKRGFLRFIERSVMKLRLDRDPDAFHRGSPWHRVGDHAPPVFMIHGAMDTLALVEDARAFAQRLREISREPVVYAELPGTQHAFDQFLSIRTLHAVRAIARFGTWAYERCRVSGADRAQPSDRDAPSPTSPR